MHATIGKKKTKQNKNKREFGSRSNAVESIDAGGGERKEKEYSAQQQQQQLCKV
jgi:hypothetical protein